MKNVLMLKVLFSNKHVKLDSDTWSTKTPLKSRSNLELSVQAGGLILFVFGKKLDFRVKFYFCAYQPFFCVEFLNFRNSVSYINKYTFCMKKVLHSKSYSSRFHTSEIL